MRMALLLAISLYTAFPAPALGVGSGDKQSTCLEALNACQDLSKAQDNRIAGLEQGVKDLEASCKPDNGGNNTIVWVLVGALAGIVVYRATTH